MVEEYLKKLLIDLELGGRLEQDDKRCFIFPFNPEMTVRVQPLDPGVLFVIPICTCPKENREEIFQLLMKANLLGQGTGGGAIALDANENFLTLSCDLPYDMNFQAFKESLEDFVNYADYWRKEIARLQE